MAIADRIFIENCKDILTNGTWDLKENVRPKWEDGKTAYTIKKFGIVNEYDLKCGIPMQTIRKQAFGLSIDELLCFFQKKSNNINDLNSHVWDQWADETGSIGKSYGYQLGVKHKYPEGEMDQVDKMLYDLKNNPFSRRIMTNIYNHHDLNEMNLYPCAYSMTFDVGRDEETDQYVLNAVLNQRSQDMLTANGWNVMQYAGLVHILADLNNMIPGKLIHVIANAHIYDRHIEIVEHLMKNEQFPNPELEITEKITDFYEVTPKTLKLVNYKAAETIKNIPVAA